MKRLAHVISAAAFTVALALPAQAAYIQCGPNMEGSAGTRLVGSALGGDFGSPVGFGESSLRWNPSGTGTFDISTFGVENVNSAGLYRGAEGTAGELVLQLTDGQNVFNDGSFNRTLDIDEDLANEIRANPGNFFIRVDSPEFQQGALRGQLGINRFFGGQFSGQTVVGGPQSTATGTFTSSIRLDDQGRTFLDYDILGDDLGDSLSSLAIFQGEAGTQGTQRLSLGTDMDLVNGRLQGSIELNDQLRNELLRNPQDFFIQGANSQFPAGVGRAQFGWSHETFVPVFGTASGAAGTHWNSDLRIFNSSHDQTESVFIEWYPRGEDASAREVATVNIQPRGSAFFTNSMSELFPGASGIGALRITSSGPVAVSARIYNTGNPDGGTFGQAVPGLSRCAALSRGVIAGMLHGGSGLSAYEARTNVGFFNPTGQNVTVHLDMNDQSGAHMADRVITLGPWAQMQVPLFGPAGSGSLFDMDEGVDAGTLSFHATGDIYAYGSVIDNTSGDATTLLPQADFSFTTPQM